MSVNTIMKKLSEIQLESHDVELSVMDDLKVSISKVTEITSKVNKMYQEADKTAKIFKEAKSQKDSLNKVYTSNKDDVNLVLKDLNNLFKTINAQAKELGIDIKSLPLYKDYLDARDELNKSSSKNQDAWNLVFNF